MIYGCMFINMSLNIYFCVRILESNLFFFVCGAVFFVFGVLGITSGNVFCSEVTKSSSKWICSMELDYFTGYAHSYINRYIKPLRPIVLTVDSFCRINSSLTLDIFLHVSSLVMDLLITF